MPTRSSDSSTRFLRSAAGMPSAIGQRQLDVLVHREIADEVEALEDESDFPVANARPIGEIQVRDRLAVQFVVARGRRVEQADDGEQG